MDEDTADLIRALLTRAGMIMEDASASALIGSKSDDGLLNEINRLFFVSEIITSLAFTANLLYLYVYYYQTGHPPQDEDTGL